MFEGQENSQASMSKVFVAEEDDLVDALLSVLRRDGCENLKMHYEGGTLTAEKTLLRIHSKDASKEEVALVFGIATSWAESDGEVELVVGVTETEFDWTQDECMSICESIIKALEVTFPTVDVVEGQHIENSVDVDNSHDLGDDEVFEGHDNVDDAEDVVNE